jgi:hypothetical protein
MSHFNFTVLAFAFRQLFSRYGAHLPRFLMTWIAEVRCAEAEPDSFIAAISAFVFYVVGSVNLAVRLTGSLGLRCALGAQQRLLNHIVNIELCTFAAVLPTHKVGIFAFKALIIR